MAETAGEMTETIEQKLALGPMSGLRKTPSTTAAPGANDVGPLLCATRMRLGKDLQDIARLLHIRYNYLVAIEDGRFEDLPGQAYAIGFVRAYAEHLGLDGDEIVRRFKDENAGVKKPASFNFPLPAPDSGVPSGLLLVVAVVMGMMVYGAWYSIAGADRRAADLIQEIPDRLAALLDRTPSAEPELLPEDVAVLGTSEVTTPSAEVQEAAAEEDAAEAPPETLASTPAEAIIAEASRPEPVSASTASVVPGVTSPAPQPAAVPARVATSAPPPAPAVTEQAKPEPAKIEAAKIESAKVEPPRPEPAAVETAKVEPPKVEAPKLEPARPEPAKVEPPKSEPTQVAALAPPPRTASKSSDVIELKAMSDSWIQVRAGDQLLLTRLLRKGEVYRVPDRTGLTLMTGNAGGIEVTVNGDAMPSLGSEGTVARGVPLEAARLKTMAKAAAPLETDDGEPD